MSRSVVRFTLLCLFVLLPLPLCGQEGEPSEARHEIDKPIGVPGAIHSRGTFTLPADHRYDSLNIFVIQPGWRIVKIHSIPQKKVKLDKNRGTWDVQLPTAQGDYQIFAAVRVRHQSSGEIKQLGSEPVHAQVPAPVKKK